MECSVLASALVVYSADADDPAVLVRSNDADDDPKQAPERCRCHSGLHRLSTCPLGMCSLLPR
eukprot:5790332-Prorocentrum_lima.AAC.1